MVLTSISLANVGWRARWLAEEEGQDLVEYALLLVLIVLVVLGAVGVLGTTIRTALYDHIVLGLPS